MVAGLVPFVPAKWAKAIKNNVLGSNPSVEKVVDYLSQKAKGASDVLATKYANLRSYLRKADDFATNPFDAGGKLKPNVKYKSGEFGYIGETDAQGRLVSMKTDNLQLTIREKRLPHDPKTPGKQVGDHAGHLFGDRFGGSNKTDNIVSQLGEVNQSAYRKIENMLAEEIRLGNKVAFTVNVLYDGSGTRPLALEIMYQIGKKRQVRDRFEN